MNMGGMKFALCVFVAALTYATATEADVANDKVCILTTLNFLKETPPTELPDIERRRVPSGFSAIKSVSVSAPPAYMKTDAPPVTSRVVVIAFESFGDYRWYYICKTRPGRQPVVKFLFDASSLTE